MNVQTMRRGSRIAKLSHGRDGYTVYVGFEGTPQIPGEEIIPARFFNGTCSRTYKTEGGALRGAMRFMNE